MADRPAAGQTRKGQAAPQHVLASAPAGTAAGGYSSFSVEDQMRKLASYNYSFSANQNSIAPPGSQGRNSGMPPSAQAEKPPPEVQQLWEQLWAAAREGNGPRLGDLLLRGAAVDSVDPWGNTALHYAAQKGDPEVVEKLLHAGANTQAKAKWGGTPADLAMQFGLPHIAKLLKEAAPAAERRAAWLQGEGSMGEAASAVAALGGDAAAALLAENRRRQEQEVAELREELQRARLREANAVGKAASAEAAAVAASEELAREKKAREGRGEAGREWEVPVGEVKFGRLIGKGGFGDVMRAVWRGQDVAVKRMAAQSPQAAEAFTLEVAVLSKLRHRNIVLFMAAMTLPPNLCIVMELAANGCLYDVIHKQKHALDADTALRWAAETSRGMAYLHSQSIIHRDLKSLNLLLDEDWHIKVSDFGLAKLKVAAYQNTQVGTLQYMAPELLNHQRYDERVDVYAFGIVMWELASKKEPFRGCSPAQIVRDVDKGERPSMKDIPPGHVPQTYLDLLQTCWLASPAQRPTFPQVQSRLEAMLRRKL